MLFAEMGNDATVFAVAMAVVAAVSAFGTACLAYLTGRDKLRFDAEHVQMRAEIKECQDDRAELRARVTDLETRLNLRGH